MVLPFINHQNIINSLGINAEEFLIDNRIFEAAEIGRIHVSILSPRDLVLLLILSFNVFIDFQILNFQLRQLKAIKINVFLGIAWKLFI